MRRAADAEGKGQAAAQEDETQKSKGGPSQLNSGIESFFE